ncbi:hypothetical protein ACFL3I_05525 [Pseudomonadota bacterium]
MNPKTIVVVGTLANDPYAGMAWMTMQITTGLRRLGHDVYYFEITSTWPYDPIRRRRVCDSNYSVPYLKRVLSNFGLENRWAYRQSFSDKSWFGLPEARAEDLLAKADVVFNITGTSLFAKEGLKTGRLVYYGTDPVWHELNYANEHKKTLEIIDEHDDVVTYGENIGRPSCLIPPLPNLRAGTRQPVLLDEWSCSEPTRPHFTTVGNWEQKGRDIHFLGQTYLWSKHHEFLKFIDLPKRISTPIELATNLADPRILPNSNEDFIDTIRMGENAFSILTENGWKLEDGPSFSSDPLQYRSYIQASAGEFTVARDLNVKLKSGWFSERSACYLAAGRPVITQDTGFGSVLPTGEGLFSFETMDDILEAFEAINSDYEHHSKKALDIAHEFFSAEKVLLKLLDDLSL